MKKSRFVFVLISFLIVSIVNAQSVKTFSVINPSSLSRENELIVLKRRDLERKLGTISKYVEIKNSNTIQPLQFDDLDGDGKWDEAVYLYSFKPKEKVSFTVLLKNTLSKNLIQKAHVRLRRKNPDDSWGPDISKEEMPFQNPATDFSKQPLPLYLTEGPAWENDKLGFRLYLDVRNGKDIWGKRVSGMVLDSVGTKVEPTYHDLHDWGMDILHVGNSLGAGALALLIPQANGKDSLLRIGGTAVVKTVYKKIADGPVRAIFQIDYQLKVNGQTITLSEQTSIWGGQYFYESKVFVSGAPLNTKLVAGMANFYDNVFRSFSNGNCGVLLSHGKQSENKDYLGMAIVVPNKKVSFFASSPNENSDITNSYLAILNIREGQPCVFRYYAAWEKSKAEFASINFFSDMLRKECEKIDHPVQVVF